MADAGSESAKGEHRRAPRVERPLIVWYRDTVSDAWLASPLRDLSEGGARFLSERAFGVGTALELQIQLPVHPVSLKARVAWEKSVHAGLVELGVTFEAGDLEIRRALTEAVSHFLRKRAGR